MTDSRQTCAIHGDGAVNQTDGRCYVTVYECWTDGPNVGFVHPHCEEHAGAHYRAGAGLCHQVNWALALRRASYA